MGLHAVASCHLCGTKTVMAHFPAVLTYTPPLQVHTSIVALGFLVPGVGCSLSSLQHNHRFCTIFCTDGKKGQDIGKGLARTLGITWYLILRLPFRESSERETDLPKVTQ